MISALLPVLCFAPGDFFRSLPPTRDLFNARKKNNITVLLIITELLYWQQREALIWLPFDTLEYPVTIYFTFFEVKKVEPSIAVLSTDRKVKLKTFS